MAEFDLLNKTELTVNGISLKNVNLDEIAHVAADTLNLERKDLLVTDVQGDNLVIDILKRGLDAHNIVAKKDELLQRLSKLPGVGITERTSVSSKGMLSWIAMESAQGRKALKRAEMMAEDIRQRLEKTAVVFSTGAEVAGGLVMDTNTPAISRRLNSEGYSVKLGPTLKDDEMLIAAHLRQAADDGYGLVITTGGVGAEDKDRTIEAVLILDPEAATPHILKYELGVGRHKHKDSVRIGVGQVAKTLIVALPGPNDEVQVGLDALVQGLASQSNKEQLAEDIADRLRKRMKEKLDGSPDAEGRPSVH
ncbi:MAG: competence/damage-inducible protein A [Desulfomonile tiedjei]|nr:competence/damage-inducible protein A [Desulfomonile tiedjei]